MFKKIAIIAILMTIFIGGTLFAQSVDVHVHGVLKGGDTVILSKKELPSDSYIPIASQAAPEGSGYTTVFFPDIPCSQDHPIWALKSEQGSRTDSEEGGISPFTTVHLYLPNSGDWKPWPEDPGPHQE